MTSPVMSSSPMSISPARRRSLSPSEISDANSIRPPRHSPTLTRSFDPNDPQVRERQRTMDVDMAMQLSLARRETLHSSPVATFTSPGGLSSSQQLQHSPQRDHEQYGEEGMIPDDDDGHQHTPHEGGISPFNPQHYQHHRRTDKIDETDSDLRNLTGGGAGDGGSVPTHDIPPLRQESLLPQQQRSHHDLEENTNINTNNYGLPTYQANFSQSAFDFAPMEEWAVAEKTRLGINSPLNTRFLLNSVRGTGGARASKLGSSEPTKPQPPPPRMNYEAEAQTTVSPEPNASPLVAPSSIPAASEGAVASGSSLVQQSSTNIPCANGEHPASPGDDPHSDRPLRHRKLSQSNSHPRSHRKGIGGKMALFESTNESPSFSARLGLVLGNHGNGIPSGSSYDHIAGVPHTGGTGRGVDGIVGGGVTGHGILTTGHDRPYRFSFYSNALSATIHARSLSELPAEGQTFEQLFSGAQSSRPQDAPPATKPNGSEAPPTLSPPYNENPYFPSTNGSNGRHFTSEKNGSPPGGGGANALTDDQDGNTWWLDVQNPTDEEMKMLSKVFNIHPLTTEDILMEETREKIELFRNYYLVCFRSFDQDPYSPTHLEPLNMYIIVFRQGTLSFHFRPTPHPQNVRRRIKQLKDYISVTSDWISYALIDDITDAFGPLIQGIEYEVDSIDELVLILKDVEQSDMLRRIGTCRKKVMGLLRLMGNKADVVKGLAKRCNENWRVAPTSDIGLYLSDIQDHLITMTQNLNHYEKILSRSHSNYLAQISIEMTDANNQINDVLSKLTALGTVLIPMNLVTGLWGMNVHVPGQDAPGYAWFISIIACLAAFALLGGYSTYRFMVRK